MECQWLTGISAGDGLQIFRRLNQVVLSSLGLFLKLEMVAAATVCRLVNYSGINNSSVAKNIFLYLVVTSFCSLKFETASSHIDSSSFLE